MRPAVQAFKKSYSPRLLHTVDRAMEVDPMLRPQSVDELMTLLEHGDPNSAVEEG